MVSPPEPGWDFFLRGQSCRGFTGPTSELTVGAPRAVSGPKPMGLDADSADEGDDLCALYGTACFWRLHRSREAGPSSLPGAISGWLYARIPLVATPMPHPRMGHIGQKYPAPVRAHNTMKKTPNAAHV